MTDEGSLSRTRVWPWAGHQSSDQAKKRHFEQQIYISAEAHRCRSTLEEVR